MPSNILRAAALAATSLGLTLLFGCAKTGPTRPLALDLDGARNCSQVGDIYLSGETSTAALAELNRRGVTTVVDLRKPNQIPAGYADDARAAGMIYLNCPMDSDEMSPEQARVIKALVEIYDDEPLLITCGSANRASAGYCVYLATNHEVPADVALSVARRTGLRDNNLAEDVRQNLAVIK